MSDSAVRPELLSFLGAVKAEPEEDTPKLALADWLQEQPDAADQARGDFLRQFVRNNQLAKNDPAREDFGALTHLWSEHEEEWAGQLRAAGFRVWATNHMFRWGLLFPMLEVGTARDAAARRVANTEQYAWVAGILVSARDPVATAAFADSPLLDSLVGLRIAWAEASAQLLVALCASPRVGRLQSLDVGHVIQIGEVARSPYLSCLRHLVVGYLTRVEGFDEVCNSPHLNALRTLDIVGAPTDEAVQMFANGTGLPALTELNICPVMTPFNRLGPIGFGALVAGARSGRLRKLQVPSHDIADAGVAALCAQPHMRNLTHLDLSHNRLTNAAAIAIAGAAHLKSLEHLNLSGNGIAADGALALANSPHLANLRWLDLAANSLNANPRTRARTTKALLDRFGGAVKLA